MGYSGDIMHDIVQKELRRNYPASEGWTISGAPKAIGNDEVFMVSKRQKSNQVASVGVSFARVVGSDLVSAVMEGKTSTAAKKSSWHSSIIVPQGADLSGLPDGIKILYMRSFRYEGKDLTWLKRPVGSSATAQSTQASS